MKNQSSNSSVDIEINSQCQKPSQQLLGPSIILKDHQEDRNKSNSSSQNSTFRKIHPSKNINEKNKRPSSVTQRPSSIPKFVSSFSNEAQKLGLNGNTRSQDDSYAVNSLISSMNNSYCVQQNTGDVQTKPKLQNPYHQRGNSLQTAIGQLNIHSTQHSSNQKGGSSQSLQNQAPYSQSLANSFLSVNQQAAGLFGDDKSASNICQSFTPAVSAQPASEHKIVGPEFNNQQASQNQFLSDNLVFKHASSLDLPAQSSTNGNSKFINQQVSSTLKYNTAKQQNDLSNLRSQKPKQKNTLENEEDSDQKDKQEEEEYNQQNIGELQQAQSSDILDGGKTNNSNNNYNNNNIADSENQTQVQIQGNSIFGINTELEKIDLNNSNSSKHTSNSITSRSHKNQSNMSDDFLQDSKLESANSMIVSSSNNSSKVFKGSSNNSFILSTCSQKPSAQNPLNDYIQSKEKIKESIKSKCSAKTRDSHILLNARLPIKPILADESKNQILPTDDKQIPSASIQVISKPSQDLNESQLKAKQKNRKQLMHRRGNTLSRNDFDDLQFFEFQDSGFQKASSEDEKPNSNQTEVKQASEENLSTNPLSFINPAQVYDFQIKNNEEDNQNEQDYQQEDQEEDIEIKKQVELLNSDDSENEDKVRNIGKPSTHHPPPGVGIYQQQIYHPIPQQQSQQQMSFHPLNPFIDIPNQSTPQIQQQNFDQFNKQSSTPNQQLEYINQKRINGPRPISIDQQFSQFFTNPNQQQIMSIPEKCGSPLQFGEFPQQQAQSQYILYESPAHQHMQSIYNQGMKQPANNMNNIIQFNQMNTSSPPIQNSQQKNYQIFQQHPQMQQIMCQIPAQHSIGINQTQQSQQGNQQQQQQANQIFSQNQLGMAQQGQQQMMAIMKNQKQHLQIQPNSLFSSNSSSTYHLPKQNCNLSQASTIDSADYINTFRSGSSYGMQDVQQDQVVKMIKQQSQQISQQLQVRNQCIQSQVQQQQQNQQGVQLNQQLNFFPNHHLGNQQEKGFYQQPNNNANQFLLEQFSSQPQFNQYQINQYQQNQQIPFTQEYMQTAAFPLQYLQVYIPQNHAQVVQQPMGQISPEKYDQVAQAPPPHMFPNQQLLNSQEMQKMSKNQFQLKQQMQGFNKPSHSKQLSCQQLGQYDSQNQVQQLQQNQIQFQQNNQYQIKNNKFNQENGNTIGQSQQGNTMSNNSMTFNNSSQNKNLNNNNSSIQSSKGKKKLEIKEEDISYDIDLDKLGEDKRTTVCIKNIPNKYQLNCVLQTIEKNNKDNFDFFYLPIDFNNKCNVGYAFINFVKPEYIRDFYLEFNGKKWKKFNSDKICSLKYATIQGIPQLQEHFQNSSVMNQREKKFKPVFLNVISNMIDKQRQQTNQNEPNKSNFINDDNCNQQMNRNNYVEGNQTEQGFNYKQNNNSYQHNHSQHSNSGNSNNNSNNNNQGGQSNTNYHKKNNSNSNNNYFNRYHNSNQKNYSSNKHEYVQKQ